MPTLTLAEAADYFRSAAARCPEVMSEVVFGVVAAGAARAKGLIGQEDPDWPELSTATTEGFYHPYARRWITGKIALGYGGAESPLLRTGQMRDSIEFSVDGAVGRVGSDDKRALWQELGADSAFGFEPTPPRPFLSKGLMEAADESFELLMIEAFASLFPRL